MTNSCRINPIFKKISSIRRHFEPERRDTETVKNNRAQNAGTKRHINERQAFFQYPILDTKLNKGPPPTHKG